MLSYFTPEISFDFMSVAPVKQLPNGNTVAELVSALFVLK